MENKTVQGRIVSVTRTTRETDISLTLNLDGSGQAQVDTGIGFFDHMLQGFARHGLFDLTVKVKGDLEVDTHHTIEDTGIVLGNAIGQAVGDKEGIVRYGSRILPMDEALILCALDLCGRPYLVYDLRLNREKVGDLLVGPGSADLLVLEGVGDYLLQNWSSAGRAKLHVSAIQPENLHIPAVRRKEVRDTVSSLRLDAGGSGKPLTAK